MTKQFLTFEDFVQFCSKYKKSMHFSSEKTGYNIAVASKATFEVDENRLSEGLLYGTIRAFHDLTNRNNSHIETNVLEANLMSMKDRPIMADIIETNKVDSEGNYIKDFNGHTIEYDEKTDKFVYIEHPVGHFVNPESFRLEYDEKYDRNFAIADVVIYEEYTDACNILRRRKSVDCSVELIIRDMAYDAKEQRLVINDFYVQGCTLLGEHVAPGMQGSKLTLKDFSEKNNSLFSSISEEETTKLIETLEALNNTLSNFNINQKLEKGGIGGMTKFEMLLEKYGKTVEEIDFEYENLSDEELEIKFAELFDDGDSSDGDGSEGGTEDGTVEGAGEDTDGTEPEGNEEDETEPVTEGENTEEPEVVSEPVANTDNTENIQTVEDVTDTTPAKTSVKSPEKYSITMSDGEVKEFALSLDEINCALYMLVNQMYGDEDTYYSVQVFEDNTLIMVDYWNNKAFRQNYSRDEDNFSLVGDRVAVKQVWLTDEEEKSLNEMKANYSSISEKLASYQAAELHAEREAILADESYAGYLETESFKTLKENIDTYSVEDLKTACELAFAKEVRKNVSTFSAKEETKPVNTFFAFAKTNHESSFLDGLLKK